ncbi:UPF0612 protein C569.01c [Striga asiatica]|uniref:UPF0612 protein C569.01c n=1 Tax=Striga asiatica TaxID=4170 RepID=A0A5A7P9D8_STRAF|nr:UPF0612 protein C569.01c [Striga asiatica]
MNIDEDHLLPPPPDWTPAPNSNPEMPPQQPPEWWSTFQTQYTADIRSIHDRFDAQDGRWAALESRQTTQWTSWETQQNTRWDQWETQQQTHWTQMGTQFDTFAGGLQSIHERQDQQDARLDSWDQRFTQWDTRWGSGPNHPHQPPSPPDAQ